MSPTNWRGDRTHLRLGEHRRVTGHDHLSLGVEGVTDLAKAHHAAVRLALLMEVVDQPCRLADADRQEAGRRGVERPSVADAALVEDAPHHTHGVEGGHPGGFVDGQDAAARRGAHARTRQRCRHFGDRSNSRATSRTRGSNTASGSRSSAPAARWWPPPPKGLHTAVAS